MNAGQTEQALQVLGLQEAVPENELRRAYLRKVREHSPERDPDGFRRVREAYEWLREARVAPAAAPEVARPPLPPDEPLTRLEAERTATETHSAVSLVETTEPSPASTDASAHAEVQALADAFVRAVEARDWPEIAQKMIALFRRPVLDDAPMPPPLLTLQTFVVLFGNGRFKRGRRLLVAFEDYVERRHIAFPGDVGARWKIARELKAVADFDESLAQALALGIQNGRLADAAMAAQGAWGEHATSASSASTSWAAHRSAPWICLLSCCAN